MQQFTPNLTSKSINRETFKIILMLLMVLDHIDVFISPYLADFFHIITRVVAVGFAYLVVEGLHYTHSRKNYLSRLLLWGVGMSVGNWLLNLFVLRKHNVMSILGDNIFLTLFLGAIVLISWNNQNNNPSLKKVLKSLAIVLLIASLIIPLEGSFVVVPFMFITQLTYGDVKRRNRAYLILMMVFALIELPMALTIPNLNGIMIFDTIAMNASDIFFILIIPLLHYYNGKIGSLNQKLKYGFYLFYPLHLWVIHLIANVL
ncbi:TraX family protein [Companilactobacillus halodurans]|uniref:Beta-carotene 15,15'-monooxygenase n=1 Tax=Companilactobacillus halodurans TaxID=2584183 RepID=A0A5P0ZXW9_9LACO|nr:TraX family protein [Companilactobacillus halodurans]MQS75161.1 hypothetical protein [Companilactobacillus halodurans]MQS97574.1 hypothetical protein [Companilactobacillus halodurans]